MLLSVLGASSALGRILLGAACDRFNSQLFHSTFVYAVSLIIAAIACGCFYLATDYQLLVICTVFYGFFSGMYTYAAGLVYLCSSSSFIHESPACMYAKGSGPVLVKYTPFSCLFVVFA